MSLDWSIKRVPNYQKRCWVEAENGKVRLDDDTNALVWGSIMVDLGTIKINNVDEWHFRIEFLKRVGIRWMEVFDDDNKVVQYYPDLEAIEDHIGLCTNVITMTRSKWINKIKRRLVDEVENTCRRLKSDLEDKREKETEA